MSRTTVCGIAPDRRPVELLELRNAYGWAPLIWSRLLKSRGFKGYLFEADGPLDDLWRDIETLELCEQMALVLTFDTGVVPFFAFDEAAQALREFDELHPGPDGHVNHLSAVADLFDSSPEVWAIGVWGTSVTCNPFDPWDDTADDYGSGLPASDWYVLERHRKRLAKFLASSAVTASGAVSGLNPEGA